jgi:prepilin-type N-terminal cleavage/methylation domain-containing protein
MEFRIIQRNIKGFTLIELVIAILVFAIGIMGVAKMQSESVKANSYSMQFTEALNIAQDHLEYLRGLAFTHTSMSTSAHNSSSPSFRGLTYNLSWRVADPGTTPPSRNVFVCVRWQDKSINHQVNFEMLCDELD